MCPYPEHFIVRPSAEGRSTIVPLIAVDQLPDWIQLAGAPRELDPEHAVGLVSLGVAEREDDDIYQVCLHSAKIRAILNEAEGGEDEDQDLPTTTASETAEDAPTPRKEKPEGEVTACGDSPVEETTPMVDVTKAVSDLNLHNDNGKPPDAVSPSLTTHPSHDDPAKPRDEKCKDKTEDPENEDDSPKPASPTLQNSRHDISGVATTPHTPKEQALRPHMTEERRDRENARRAAAAQQRAAVNRERFYFGSNPDTVYCRHWCHHGTCKWGWECRYQHRMPTSREGLREVGLKDFPMWYLLMMSGFPGGAGGGSDAGLLGRPGFHVNALNVPMNHANNILAGLDGGRAPPHPADALLGTLSRVSPQSSHQLAQLPSLHPSPIDLRLMQGRMPALLAGSAAMSNRQKLRQMKEMRELLMRTGNSNTNNALTSAAAASHHALSLSLAGDLHSPAGLLHGTVGSAGDRYYAAAGRHPHQGRATLHTNASLAANAARLARDAERGANAPVDIPPAAVKSVAERKGKARAESVGGFDELDGRLSPVSDDGGDDEMVPGLREGTLVDID